MSIIVVLIAQIAAASDVDLAAEIQRLVRRLDAPQLSQREAAEAELFGLGPAALDLLPPADDRQSAEVQQRLVRVRQRLERLATEAVAKTSTITLHSDGMPVEKILAAMQEQSRNTIRRELDQSAAEATLKVDFDKAPFWRALDDVSDRAGLSVYPFAERRAIDVSTAPPDRKKTSRVGRASYAGPFRIEPTDVIARRNIGASGYGVLRIFLEVAWEPRVQVIYLTHPMADVLAKDQRGEPLPVANREAQPEISVGQDASAVKLDIPLKLPPRSAEKIASLNGKLLATLAGKVGTFRFDALSDAQDGKTSQKTEKRIAGAVVSLEGIRRSGPAWEVRMRVRFDEAGDALASHRQWIFNNEARLETADGKSIPYDNYETTFQSKNELGQAYFFRTDLPLDRLSFIYKTSGAIITAEFPYELKDISLP